MKKLESVLRDITGCKSLSVSFSVRLKTGILHPDSSTVEINLKNKRCIIYNTYAKTVEETIWVSWNGHESLWQRSIKNVSGKTLKLVETEITLQNIDFGKKCRYRENYFYHVENPRIYKLMTIPIEVKLTPEMVKKSEWDCLLKETGYIDPAITTERIGASPYQPFPAVLLSNYGTNRGLVHGTLNQDVFYHNYTFSNMEKKVKWSIFSSMKSIEYRNFQKGETISSDMWYIGATEYAHDLEKVFQGYLGKLRRYLPVNMGKTDVNRHYVMWGSANDGTMQDIDQERILKTSECVKNNLPSVKWIYIDWGYGKTGEFKGGISLPYEGESGIDRKKFPEGMKRFADKIKLMGLKPAVWIAGMVERDKLIAKERPEWFYDRFPSEKSARILDVSIPDVQEYMKKALDKFLIEYGFQGVKHDLWSYPFEDSRPVLSEKDRSGYELRKWWLMEMRKRLPATGYMQTGCDIVMANPFLGEYFNNYRYGIDVVEGHWENVETNMLWGAACFACHCGDLIVPNSDAIGVLPGLKEREYLFWLNYCIISKSVAETAGWIHENRKHPRYRFLRKALCCPNNGQDVFFIGYDYRKTHKPPCMWYFQGAHFSLLKENQHLPLRTVAVFNLSEKGATFKVETDKIVLDSGKFLSTDVWTLKTESFENCRDIYLEPKESVLFSISRKDAGPQVLDSDVKIEDVSLNRGNMSLKIICTEHFRIVFSHQPKKAEIKGNKGSIRIIKGEENWVVEGKTGSPCLLNVFFPH